MAKINLELEILANHSDEEVIEHLDGIMTGLLKNYKLALERREPEILWGNLGDISIVASIIREMKKRNLSRQAQKNAIQ